MGGIFILGVRILEASLVLVMYVKNLQKRYMLLICIDLPKTLSGGGIYYLDRI
jgi:hypothetical protein